MVSRIGEIRFVRIVEGQVTIFADPQQAYLWTNFGEAPGIFALHQGQIRSAAINFKKFADGHALRQIGPQVAAKRRRMMIGDADVFIQMKSNDFFPWDIGHGG